MLIVLTLPSICLASDWLGGRDAVVTIVTVDRKAGDVTPITFTVAEVKATIYPAGSIRRERSSGGTVAASLNDLRPGVRIRAVGGFGTSPPGFIATKIFIQTK